jgi:ankyrin repeat protein
MSVNVGMDGLRGAAIRGDVKEVKALLKAGADVDEGVLADGWTPLHMAVNHGHLAVIRVLLEAGADPAVRALFIGSIFDTIRISRYDRDMADRIVEIIGQFAPEAVMDYWVEGGQEGALTGPGR